MCVRYKLMNSMFSAYVPHLIAAIGMDFRKPYSQCQVGYIFLFVKYEKFLDLDLGSKRISFSFSWSVSSFPIWLILFVLYSIFSGNIVSCSQKNEGKISLGDFMHIW